MVWHTPSYNDIMSSIEFPQIFDFQQKAVPLTLVLHLVLSKTMLVVTEF